MESHTTQFKWVAAHFGEIPVASGLAKRDLGWFCFTDQLSEAGKMLDLITATGTISTANQVSHRRVWQSNFDSMAVGGVPSDTVKGIINHTKLMPITTDVFQWLFHIFSRWAVVDIYAQNYVARYLEKRQSFLNSEETEDCFNFETNFSSG